MVRAPLFLCPIMVLCLAAAASAANIIAASCSSTSVQEAIDSATNADTVQIPAGICVWADQVTIPNTKGITLQGAGQGVTIIQGTSTTTHTLSVSVANGNALTRITAMTFDANELVFPIPNREIIINPGLDQNPGYGN